jgi:hypothetical protein
MVPWNASRPLPRTLGASFTSPQQAAQQTAPLQDAKHAPHGLPSPTMIVDDWPDVRVFQMDELTAWSLWPVYDAGLWKGIVRTYDTNPRA